MQIVHRDDHSLVRTTIAEEIQHNGADAAEQLNRFLVKTSGCFTYFMSAEHAETINNQRNTDLYRSGQYIIIVNDFVHNLTDDEIRGIYYHELGHVRLGHLNPEYSVNRVQINGVLVDLETEVQADSFAVAVVGKEVLKSGLNKLFRNSAEFIAKIAASKNKDISYSEALQEILSDRIISHRLQSLN